jgi:hypothetical protein
MKKLCVLVLALLSGSAYATTYTVTAGSSAATIQATLNLAGASAGNVVSFSPGAYSLGTTLQLPCSNGTVYTGPNVGIVTQSNLPAVVLSNTVPTAYAMSTGRNGTAFTGTQGCTIQYLRFSGTQGGILVRYPASGITIQQNAFDNNNPAPGGNHWTANIWLDGQNAGFSAATGVQSITVVWNTFFNNCAAIRALAYPDSGGRCAATWVNAYNNYLIWSNNTVNLTEEGLKLSEQPSLGISSLNADVEDNNLQGNSRIMIETQQDTNGVGVYSHNAFYQPFNPSNNTFELSMPEYTPSIAPTHIASDNVFIGAVPVTTTVGGKHYGIGLELWGAGSIATYNLFQGANGAETCGGGWWCSGWQICLGGTFTNGTIANNYFSGTDQWAGTANNMRNALTYEESASAANAGMVVTGNTVVETSTTIATVAPTIAAVASSNGSVITLSDSDTNRHLSIFYTTDGTTPAIFTPGQKAGTTQLYIAPFTVAPGTTVQAIASWGQGANQGIVFPTFGYVPSSVASLSVTGTERMLTGAYLRPKYYTNSVVPGGTMQFVAYGTYSDGSVAALPDAQGNAVTLWNTSNHNVAKISTQGHATAYAPGTVSIVAVIGNVKATPWTLNVTTGLSPAANAQVKATSNAHEQAAVATAADGPVPAPPGAPKADKFHGPFWQLVTPAGGSASISGAHLFLGVPGGASHDPLGGTNQAVRVVQAIGNQDFDVAIKIDSPLVPSDGQTSEGLMVLADNEDFLTFALGTDGSKVGLHVATVSHGATSAIVNDPDFTQYQNPMYLRLIKHGGAYVAFYSGDGVAWSQAANFNYAQPVSSIGPFAGNYSDTPAHALPVVMSVNWFDVQP